MRFLFDKDFQQEIIDLRSSVERLQAKVEFLEEQQINHQKLAKFHLVRVKNNEELSDDFLLKGLSYLDLSPEKAFKLYSETDRDFILLDVSKSIYNPPQELPEAKKIALEDLDYNFHLIHGKAVPIFVICEDGTRSILACKKLNKLGFFNLNNISGGYKFWRGFRKADLNVLLHELKEA